MKLDPIKPLSQEELREATAGGLNRMIPIVKLWDMLRGKSQPVRSRDPRDDAAS
jgi:hypothetical protein